VSQAPLYERGWGCVISRKGKGQKGKGQKGKGRKVLDDG